MAMMSDTVTTSDNVERRSAEADSPSIALQDQPRDQKQPDMRQNEQRSRGSLNSGLC
jgi:hypothetical protein